MKIGIVGSEASKFDAQTEEAAKEMIRAILLFENATTIVSGACHLGGIDIWAAEIGREQKLEIIEFKPAHMSWTYGYKPRNIQIAETSDKVFCLTVKRLPGAYNGMVFSHCYHCGTPPDHHIKSGGCWTLKYARKLGKPTQLIVIE
jgi:hypothetical protein